MSTIEWTPGLNLGQDPDAIRDYALDFSDMVGLDTISSLNLTPTNCTATIQSQLNATAVLRVSNVTPDASVQIRVATTAGVVDDRTLYFHPLSK